MYEQNNEFELELQWYNKALKEYALQYAQRFIDDLEKKQKESDNASQSEVVLLSPLLVKILANLMIVTNLQLLENSAILGLYINPTAKT